MKQKSVAVALINKAFIDQAKQLFSSLYFNAHWQGDYLLLHDNLAIADLTWFKKRGIYTKRCTSPTSSLYWAQPLWFSKFDIYKQFMKQWKIVVYLDTDIIVRSRFPIADTIKGLRAAPEVHNRLMKDQFFSISTTLNDLLTRDGVHLKKRAFNAGVLMFNTNIITSNTYGDLVRLSLKYDSYVKFADQTIQNIYFQNIWKPLPRVYNQYPEHLYYYYHLPSSFIRGAILHFVGNMKHTRPWHSQNPFFVQAILILWFYATPIIYSLGQIPRQFLWLWRFNPLTSILQLMQFAFLQAPMPGPAMLASNVAVTVIIAYIGILVFQRESRNFDDWL